MFRPIRGLDFFFFSANQRAGFFRPIRGLDFLFFFRPIRGLFFFGQSQGWIIYFFFGQSEGWIFSANQRAGFFFFFFCQSEGWIFFFFSANQRAGFFRPIRGLEFFSQSQGWNFSTSSEVSSNTYTMLRGEGLGRRGSRGPDEGQPRSGRGSATGEQSGEKSWKV